VTRKAEIAKTYSPKEIEERWGAFWLDNELSRAEAGSGKEPFTIVIPPPNVTGVLHMGHALDMTLQDVLTRYRRMLGREALWLPGTDHAAIATTNVAERRLAKENVSRHDLGREKFSEEVWKVATENRKTIINQLKLLGCSCDWSRERFTLDEGLSQAVRTVFVRLYEKGMIYRGKYVTNWCPRCHTALSNDEVEHEEQASHLWYINYPLKDGSGDVQVATTRPETMLGDTAVAVSPKDERYKNLVDKTCILPLVGSEIPIIADMAVDSEFGTGAVKVTPAHDPNDFEIAQRNDLPYVMAIGEDARMTENVPTQYQGLDRYACRENVVRDLEAQGYLVKIEDHSHAVGVCYRCKTVIEPLLSDQWFVRMAQLAKAAKDAVEDGRITIHPARWTKVYYHWLDNIRDWCISRQIWWGHRIPIWYCEDCNELTISLNPARACSKCGSDNIRQDEDTLDTWFSSWLWPFSTLGWPGETEDLAYFYPTDVLVSGYDILFLWVARMIMAGLEFMGEVPYRDVFLHGMVLDESGKWMSKSSGNIIDPLDMIDEYGADAVRFSIVSLCSEGQDIKLSQDKFEMGRNFCNKIWNAYRFLALNSPGGALDGTRPDLSESPLEDRWIASALTSTIEEMSGHLEGFSFNETASTIYHFFWHSFCDWYLEIIKPRLSKGGPDGENAAQVGFWVLRECLRLLHPLMPFITEEIWQGIPCNDRPASIVRDSWPTAERGVRDGAAEKEMDLVQRVVTSIRTIRGEMGVPPKTRARVLFRPLSEDAECIITQNSRHLALLANCSEVEKLDGETPAPASKAFLAEVELFLPLEGLIDIGKEQARLEKELESLKGVVQKTEGTLGNKKFVENAPANVVDAQRQKLATYQAKLEKVKASLADLQ
jgi:valyl-tRNA synthetase